MQLYDECGACEGIEVEAGDNPRRGTIRFLFAGGKVKKCEIEIDGAAKAKIIYALF